MGLGVSFCLLRGEGGSRRSRLGYRERKALTALPSQTIARTKPSLLSRRTVLVRLSDTLGYSNYREFSGLGATRSAASFPNRFDRVSRAQRTSWPASP